MSAEKIIGNLLWLANDDLDDARDLQRRGKRNAAYHIEQAAEKTLKAVLVSEGIPSGTGHQLEVLASQIPDENPFKPRLLDIDELTAFATTYRYVTGGGRIPAPPDPAEMTRWIAEVDTLIQEIAARFGVDLSRKDTPAKWPGPIRNPQTPQLSP